MNRPKLYCSERSPFARKVRIVLHELDVDFEMDVLNALRPIEEVSSINPALSVPVLETSDQILFESNLILEYLLTTYGTNVTDRPYPPLFPLIRRPNSLWTDGKTLSVLEALGNSIVNTSLMTRYGGVEIDNSEYLQRQQARISACLDWLEAAATPEGFVRGWFSVLDINFICHIGYGEGRGVVELGDRPSLQALRLFFSERPSIRVTEVPET